MKKKKRIRGRISETAIIIKNKEIKKKAILDEISNDSTDDDNIESVKKIARKIEKKKQMKFKFV